MPFKLVRNDIIHMDVDAIVNTANPMPIIGSGTDSGIYQAAGLEQLLAARKEIGEMSPGQAALTPGFGLKAGHIIHIVGPKYIDGTQGEAKILKACYDNSLALAEANNFESIAFPLISSGNYGYPKDEALHIAVSSISSFLLTSDMLVYLVVFDNEAFRLSGKLFKDIDTYIDEKYVQEKMFAEHLVGSASKLHETVFESRPFYEKSIEERESKIDEPVCAAATFQYSLADAVNHIEEDFSQRLFRLIDERGLKDPDVYKKANIDRKLFSKIRCNADYQPKKNTAIALALALELNLDETKDLLSRAGYALSPSSKSDIIIQYFIEKGVYDIIAINMALFDHNLPCLGD